MNRETRPGPDRRAELEIGWVDGDAQLLAQLPHERIGRDLTGLDVSARQIQRFGFRPRRRCR